MAASDSVLSVAYKSNDTILKIAGKYGYGNGRKFAEAFKDAFRVTPNKYRKAESS